METHVCSNSACHKRIRQNLCRRDDSSIHNDSPSHRLERWRLHCWRVSIETQVDFFKCRINTENIPTKVVITNNASKCWTSFPSFRTSRYADKLWNYFCRVYDCFSLVCMIFFKYFCHNKYESVIIYLRNDPEARGRAVTLLKSVRRNKISVFYSKQN